MTEVSGSRSQDSHCLSWASPSQAALTSVYFLQQALIGLPKGHCSLSIHAHFKCLSIQRKAIKDQRCFSRYWPPASHWVPPAWNSTVPLPLSFPLLLPWVSTPQTLFSNILMCLRSTCYLIHCITKSPKCTLNGCFSLRLPCLFSQNKHLRFLWYRSPFICQAVTVEFPFSFPTLHRSRTWPSSSPAHDTKWTLLMSRTWPSSSPAHDTQMKSSRPWRFTKAPDSLSGSRTYVIVEQMAISHVDSKGHWKTQGNLLQTNGGGEALSLGQPH